MEKTLNISDQELHTTLNEFLEEKEKKPKESIWNFSTVAGLVLVLTSAAYVGLTIGTEVLGIGSIPAVNTIMQMAPYFGGAVLGLLIISMFSRSKSEKIEEKEEKQKVRETYDKLDKFLYQDYEGKSSKKTRSKSRSSASTSGFSSKSKSTSKFERYKVGSSKRLMKSRTDKKIAGVCGGLAKHLGISSTVLRLIFVAAIILGWGSFMLVYIALAFVMPKEPVYEMDDFKSF